MPTQVLSTTELIAQLGSRGKVRAAVRSGKLTRVLHGVYADGPVDLGVRAAAARIVLPEDALVCGYSALWLWQLDVAPRALTALEVLVPRGAVLPRRAGLRAREGLVAPADRTSVRGVPILAPARIALDLARTCSLVEGVVVCDALLRRGLVSEDDLCCQLTRASGLRAVVRARTAIGLADGRAESPPETRLRVGLVQSGVRVVPQFEVHDAVGRLVARLDLAIPELRLALEYDGRDPHGNDAAFIRDRQRQNDLVAMGWTVLRFTSADLRNLPAVIAQVLGVADRLRPAA